MVATAARRNGSPAKRAKRPATRPSRPAPPPAEKPLTTEERLDRLEQGLAALGGQLRQFMAQQLLQDPRVQEMLQQQIAARLGGIQEPPQ